MTSPSFDAWLAALERRHLASLTRGEVTRALRALSSCYVERRDRLAGGGALDGAGKRAAFALFYAPLHLLTIAEVVRALAAHEPAPDVIDDLGCGTGAGSAAWALACATPPRISGVDRSAWAVEEANWTYRTLQLRGHAKTGDVVRNYPGMHGPRSAVLLAYTVNELPDEMRASLFDRILRDARSGRQLLIVEAIARRDKAWWPEWEDRLGAEGARADEWRFPAALPPPLRQTANAAGLDPRALTARTLYVPAASAADRR